MSTIGTTYKMKIFLMFLIHFLYFFDGISGEQYSIRDTSQHLLSRQKRYLVWKTGVNWVSVIFGIGIPVEVDRQSITLGMVMKAYYQLPNNSSYYTHPSIDYERKKRAATRWSVYEMIENYFERNNYGNGKSCILRSICQVSATPLDERTGILSEILHSILTPSSTDDEMDHEGRKIYHDAEHLGKNMEDCHKLFPECQVDLVQQFSRVMDMASSKYSLY